MGRTLFFIVSVLFTCTRVRAHLVDGIFTEPTLELGYHLIANIPIGASNLNVSQLRHTNNYLAVRLQDDRFLLNGNYSISWSGSYKAAGTTFVYHRQTSQQMESLTAVGPLQEPIDLMILYQEPNPGIVYRYVSPGGTRDRNSSRGRIDARAGEEFPSGSPKRYRKRKFAWKFKGFTSCSKTCGGGVQSKIYVCVREFNQVHVPAKRCHALEKPGDLQARCNIGPCPPRWRMGAWSTCSVSCGTGTRVRNYECVQEVNHLLTVRVSDGACMDSKISPENEPCSMPACEIITKSLDEPLDSHQTSFHWNIGEWSSCSTSCGLGKRRRMISCPRQDCSSSEMPSSEESCDLGPCPPSDSAGSSFDAKNPHWLHTEWSRACSAECGTGFQTRKVICVSGGTDDSTIESDDRLEDKECEKFVLRPDSTRTCSSDKSCSGHWFTGPWTRCSSICDLGEQTREAICVTRLQGSLRLVLDMNCPPTKPETRRACRGPPCPATWYTSEWTECTRSCGTGTQSRQVRCVNHREKPELSCNETERPTSTRVCNDYPCRETIELRDGEMARSRYFQNDPEAANGILQNDHCNDSTSNCGLVTQARLCIYPFYKKMCCLSCSKARREELE